MQKWRLMSWAIPLLFLPVLLIAGDAEGGSKKSAKKQTMNLEYAKVGKHSLKLDLYLPANANNPPLVIWIHGGAWLRGSRKKVSVRWLTEHGFAVASISYRFSNVAIFPAQIHDCKAALRWLRAHAEEYGYSTDKVAVTGYSSGGMLAALLATSAEHKELEGTLGNHKDQSTRVDAAVSISGPTDFVLRAETQPRSNDPRSATYKLLGGRLDKKMALATLASAARHVTPDDPPMLVFHGAKDPIVSPGQAQAIKDAYDRQKLPLELHVVKEANHGIRGILPEKRRPLIISFLKKHLKAE